MLYRFLKNNQLLSSPESRFLNHFQLRYQYSVSIRQVQPIFRGESLEAVYDKFGLDTQYGGLEQLSKRLFLFGDIARHYFSATHFEKPGEEFAIDDCSETVLRYVFKQVQKTVIRKHQMHQAFYEKNAAFATYFLERANLTDFVIKLEQLPYQDRLAARNYYLKLVHQFSTQGYQTKSHVVSTSKSYKVAWGFAKNLVLHAWDPSVPVRNLIVKKRGLPVYAGAPYRQAEVTLLGEDCYRIISSGRSC
ncbi:MAG: hypothetical protein JWP69_2177 [Flaviaesturariibacter sp.]|nr:hypothetical protein [Flaviaesturariibacter sp.]